MASHAAGAELTYEHLGGNTYRFKYVLYRDCDGIPVQASYPITVTNSCGLANPIIVVTQDSFAELPHGCPFHATRCTDFNSPLMGIQAYYYHEDVILPGPCANWVFGYAECCRTGALTNLITPSSWNLYGEATLNNQSGNVNNSARFSELPEIFLCPNTIQYYFNTAWDPDGDSLLFELTCPLTSAGTPTQPAPGFTCTQPVSYSLPGDSTVCNPANGEVVFHADAPQISAVMMLIKEYRGNTMIGSVMRDMNLIFENCGSGNLPTASGMNGNPVFTAHICVDSLFSFFIETHSGTTQPTFLTWDNGIPGASFTNSGTFRDTGYFSWHPGVQDTGSVPHEFTVTVFDGYCFSNSYVFQIYVDSCYATSDVGQIATTIDFFQANYFESQIRFSFLLSTAEKSLITLMDYTGQVLSVIDFQQEKKLSGFIDCAGFSKGVYLLTLETGSGIRRTIRVVIMDQ